MAATLEQFAVVNDAAAAVSSKLAKQKALAEYFRPLDPADLPLAVRFAGARVFSASDERVLGASGAIVMDALRSLLNIDPAEFRTLAIRSGEIGEALAAIWNPKHLRTEPTGEPLTLGEMMRSFDDLAATGNQATKRQIVATLFARCRLPREAAYLAKIIFADLRTGVKEGVLQAAVAQSFGATTAQIQRAQLLVGDLGEVALLAQSNQLDTASFKLFHPIQFMLATPKETAEELAVAIAGRSFVSEEKLDGIRAQIHKSGDRIAIYTRTMDRTDESFPDVVAMMRRVPGDFLLDGEIVPYRDGVVQPFASIQKRLGRKVLSAKMLREHPASFVAFDLLYLNGELLMDKPLRERRIALDALAVLASTISPMLISTITPVESAEQIEQAFTVARERRNEGLILKDLDSPYSPGRRGQVWFKLKSHLPTLDCVVTAAEYGHGKRRGSLSDYTFAVWDRDPAEPDAKLLNIGKAFSGVTDAEIAELTALFLSIAASDNGRVFQVKPQVVLEIAFDQIQKSTRHASGFAFRFPRIKHVRRDKRPEDADRITRVEEIYASAANTALSTSEPVLPEPELTLWDLK